MGLNVVEDAGQARAKRGHAGVLPMTVRIVTVVLAVVVAASGCSSGPDLTSQQYIAAHAKTINAVRVEVQAIQAGTAILQKDGGDAATMASFVQLLNDAQTTFDGAKSEFAGADDPVDVKDVSTELFSAADKLSTSVDNAKAYVDKQTPTDLADFGTNFGEGRSWWNEALGKVYGSTGGSVPTV